MANNHNSTLGSYARKIQYRTLLVDVETLDDSSGNRVETIDKAHEIVEEAEKLLRVGGIQERVEHPGEGLLDSKVLVASSDVASRCANSISGNVNVYNPDELADHIRNNPQYWSKVCFPKSIPIYKYLQGTFLPGPVAERPQRVRRQVERQKVQQLQEPENVTVLEKAGEASVVVSQIKKFIGKSYKNNNSKPLSFLHLILDPTDFGKTIENIYHTSFLVRDGLVAITINESNGLPYISPVSKGEWERDTSSGHTENNQFIMSIDMHDWKQLLDAFNIQQPMMNIH